MTENRVNWIEVLESYVGSLLAMLLAIEVVVGGIVLVIDPPSGNIHLSRLWSIPLLATAIVFDGWLLINVWSGLRDRRFPVALWVTLRHPAVPLPFRPIVVAVWLAHATVVALMAFGMHRAIDKSSTVGGLDFAIEAALFTTVFGMTFLCNIYFLLAIQAIAPRNRLIYLFWRIRLLFDLVLFIAALVAGHLLSRH